MRQDASILIIDDDPASIQVLARLLGEMDEMGELRFALDGEEGLALARQAAPDLVLLDAGLPGLDGFEVCRRLKADADLASVPVIFVTAQHDTATELAGLSAGAVDCIGKPPLAPIVVARVRTQLRLKQLADELRRAALTDALTGLANRRRFDEQLEREWLRAQRQGAPLSLLMIDIDHFKPFNDHYGHQEGDRCIQAVARLLDAQAARGTDLAARYGGEEFALLLPETGLDDAIQLANDCVSAMAALALPHEHFSVAEVVTLSIGVTTLQGVEADAEQLVRRADAALYRAKREGRKGVRSG